jgi:hypothetical protein
MQQIIFEHKWDMVPSSWPIVIAWKWLFSRNWRLQVSAVGSSAVIN